MEDALGLLKVRVIRGTDLVVRDTKSSDPLVLLTMGEQKVKTRVEKDSCNPEWNEELTLMVKDLNRAVMLEVYDNDTFTTNDSMGDAVIDIRPYMKFVKMGEQELPSGTKIERILPDENNDLAEESWIVWENGKFLQTMRLKLRDIESGQVEVQIEWVPIPGRELPR